MTALSGAAAAPSVSAVSSLALSSSPLKRRSAQFAAMRQSAAVGGKSATVAAKAAKRSICRYAAKCRRGRQERTEKQHVAALSGATLATVRSSKKVSVCQGRAAFGGCFANLDSLPPFCKGLEAARVKGFLCAKCMLCHLTHSPLALKGESTAHRINWLTFQH